MDFTQTHAYWEERAAADGSAQSTTQDVYMREIERRVLSGIMARFRPASVVDIGCGDARTTAALASEFKDARFMGGDYSEAMLANARAHIEKARLANLDVALCDVSQPLPFGLQQMAYTTRCLINLPSWQLQQTAIKNIAGTLAEGGTYVMIENFIEGHDNLNRVRADFGLPAIAVRSHNLFFVREKLLNFLSDNFAVVEEINISSSYYLASRVVYSKICQDQGVAPDYFDAHHKYAAALPFCGEFGPVRMLVLRKK